MKILLLLLFPLLAAAGHSLSQDTITVDATGEIMVAADIVQLHVNITVAGNSAAEVYDEHKRLERYLAGIVGEYDITGDDLVFQPMRIGTHQIREGKETRSSQSVTMTIDDFSLFEKIQVMLIENGFDNFRSNFGSTFQKEGEDQALDLAISNAREKAQQIAKSLGKSLGDVRSVEHTSYSVRPLHSTQYPEMRADTGSMMEFEQSFSVSGSVRMIFCLEGEPEADEDGNDRNGNDAGNIHSIQ